MKRSVSFSRVASRLAWCGLAATLLAGCVTADSPLGVRTIHRNYVGPTVGFGINSPSGTYHSQTAEPDCYGFTGGSGTGLSFGLAYEYWFKQNLSSNGIVARVMYQQMPSDFTTDYGSVLFLNPQTNQTITVAETHTAKVTYNLITARIAYLFAVPNTALGFEFGPSIGLANTLNLQQTLHLAGSPDISFGNGTSDSTVYDQSPASKSGIRFGLWAGAQYKFDVGWWIITPFLGYDIGLTKVLSTASWSMSSISAGVDFKYGIK